MAIPDPDPPSTALKPFLAKDFDPVDYLNAQLPSWPIPTKQSQPQSQTALADLTSKSQSLASQLSALLTRQSATLTRHADDVLRSGSRLAYEVEVLRGDGAALADALATDLAADVARLAPDAPARPTHARARSRHLSVAGVALSPAAAESPRLPPTPRHVERRSAADAEADAALRRLQTLAHVREKLDGVVRVFGAASEWALPPSDVSLAASFISVSGPSGSDEAEARERRGKEYAERVRGEVVELLDRDRRDGDDEGLRAAAERVERLRELVKVWEGTAEEKARTRFVDSLARLVDERRKAGRGGGGGGYGIRGTAETR